MESKRKNFIVILMAMLFLSSARSGGSYSFNYLAPWFRINWSFWLKKNKKGVEEK